MGRNNIILLSYEKSDQQTTGNYHPNFLWIRNKISDCFIMKRLFFLRKSFNFSQENRFRPGNSTINQLLPINHEVLNAFDIGLEVLRVID